MLLGEWVWYNDLSQLFSAFTVTFYVLLIQEG